ncbi:hypothetical protein Btru_055735 [Bulinus truncatus]|nr:hypothetical protein Btru_055735 [Bulinus truncatus]
MIRMSLTFTVLAVGIPGNILTVKVLKDLRNESATLTIYMTVFDSLALIVKSMFVLFSYLKPFKAFTYCVLYPVVIYFQSSASWTQVCVCAERFISVAFPLHRSNVITLKRVHAAVGLLCGLLLLELVLLYFIVRRLEITSISLRLTHMTRLCGIRNFKIKTNPVKMTSSYSDMSILNTTLNYDSLIASNQSNTTYKMNKSDISSYFAMMKMCLTWAILAIGLPGNILTIQVLKDFKSESGTLTKYMMVFDSLALVFKGLDRVLAYLQVVDLDDVRVGFDDVDEDLDRGDTGPPYAGLDIGVGLVVETGLGAVGLLIVGCVAGLLVVVGLVVVGIDALVAVLDLVVIRLYAYMFLE